MVHDKAGFRALGLQLKFHDRVDSVGPIADAPGLHDALIGQEFDVSPRDHAAKARKRASRLAIDSRRCAPGEITKLFGIEECVVDAFGAGGERDFLVYRLSHVLLQGRAVLTLPARQADGPKMIKIISSNHIALKEARRQDTDLTEIASCLFLG